MGFGKRATRVHKIVRAHTLFGVRHLAREDLLEFFRRHAGTSQHALALQIGTGADDNARIDASVSAGFEQQRHLEHGIILQLIEPRPFLGRLDDETTANVGLIQGGTARNIVPDRCSFSIDVRSHDERKLADLVQEMLETITFAAALEQCEAETTVDQSYRGYRFARGDLPVRMACAALEREGFEPRLALGGGGADANVFNERGRPCVNLANGMTAIHTPDEHIAIADLEQMVEVTLALVEVARAAPPGD